MAMRKYVEGETSWFTSDFPDKRDSLGGKLASFILCRGEHLTILPLSYLGELAGNAGFESPQVCQPGIKTKHPQVFDQAVLATEDRAEDQPHTLVVEGLKAHASLAHNNFSE
jgi:hypothetical protein